MSLKLPQTRILRIFIFADVYKIIKKILFTR